MLRSRSWRSLCVALGLVGSASAGAQQQDIPHCQTTQIEVERLWCQGGEAFLQQTPAGFAQSIGPYSRAFELDKKQRVLAHDAWIALIDNLGMAYGITGHLDEARAVFEYGLTKEPTYPLFYYNMACVYAETGNQAKVIEYLRRAFELRGNMLPGETMPDPSTDDSFQRFMRDEKFVAALRTLPGRQ